jgi:hypothetical protein
MAKVTSAGMVTSVPPYATPRLWLYTLSHNFPKPSSTDCFCIKLEALPDIEKWLNHVPLVLDEDTILHQASFSLFFTLISFMILRQRIIRTRKKQLGLNDYAHAFHQYEEQIWPQSRHGCKPRGSAFPTANGPPDYMTCPALIPDESASLKACPISNRDYPYVNPTGPAKADPDMLTTIIISLTSCWWISDNPLS